MLQSLKEFGSTLYHNAFMIFQVIILITILVIAYLAFTAPPHQYKFHQGMDVVGNNIGQFDGSIRSLKNKCSSMSLCVGFNTDGILKSRINRDLIAIPKWKDDPSKGIYAQLR